jgi:hypothetical protein
MTAANIILSQVGVTRKNGSSFTNPLTVTIMTYPTDEEIITKSIFSIPSPKTTSAQEGDTSSPDYGANSTKFVDILNKVEDRITIDGSLVNGTMSGDSSTLALDRKKDLKKIVTGGGVFNMTYEGETFLVNTDQISVRKTSGTVTDSDEFVEVYNVKFTAIKGVNF